ncbi:glycosyltransferase family 4 protein [Sungkyunkwania multivorans]|uniref:Glycosyltransferase family 4 protein n=1 Tax=Sungkyunkwania multivorans TaxID=1173618 RepID=A0ABW3CX58_9FLAO
MEDSRHSIIYIYPAPSTFIKKDIDFLSKNYAVKVPKHHWSNKWSTPINFFKQFLFLCRHLFHSKAVIVMFGGYWSFLPSLFGRLFKTPVFIILGGTDCVSFPSLGYGSLRKPVLRTFIKWSYQLCTKLIPVHESLVLSENKYFLKVAEQHQGYKHHFPGVRTDHEVIHNGFDPLFSLEGPHKKERNSFITVASINDMTRFKLKGIDIIFELAKVFKECSFTIIGMSKDVERQLPRIPKNVSMHPFLSQKVFKTYLYRSEFYLQLSISEGFPNALGEAMLCECIPIGTSVGAIPDIIDDTGFVITERDKDLTLALFEKILEMDDATRSHLRKKSRQRIIEEFNISERARRFEQLIDSH